MFFEVPWIRVGHGANIPLKPNIEFGLCAITRCNIWAARQPPNIRQIIVVDENVNIKATALVMEKVAIFIAHIIAPCLFRQAHPGDPTLGFRTMMVHCRVKHLHIYIASVHSSLPIVGLGHQWFMTEPKHPAKSEPASCIDETKALRCRFNHHNLENSMLNRTPEMSSSFGVRQKHCHADYFVSSKWTIRTNDGLTQYYENADHWCG